MYRCRFLYKDICAPCNAIGYSLGPCPLDPRLGPGHSISEFVTEPDLQCSGRRGLKGQGTSINQVWLGPICFFCVCVTGCTLFIRTKNGVDDLLFLRNESSTLVLFAKNFIAILLFSHSHILPFWLCNIHINTYFSAGPLTGEIAPIFLYSTTSFGSNKFFHRLMFFLQSFFWFICIVFFVQ